jgi:hypothetical protein
VTRSNESAKKVAEIVNTGLKNLDGSIEGMSITEGDIDDITAEWQGVKSEKSLQCKSIRHGELIAVDLNASLNVKSMNCYVRIVKAIWSFSVSMEVASCTALCAGQLLTSGSRIR